MPAAIGLILQGFLVFFRAKRPHVAEDALSSQAFTGDGAFGTLWRLSFLIPKPGRKNTQSTEAHTTTFS